MDYITERNHSNNYRNSNGKYINSKAKQGDGSHNPNDGAYHNCERNKYPNPRSKEIDQNKNNESKGNEDKMA